MFNNLISELENYIDIIFNKIALAFKCHLKLQEYKEREKEVVSSLDKVFTYLLSKKS